jgi:hypothetical protein
MAEDWSRPAEVLVVAVPGLLAVVLEREADEEEEGRSGKRSIESGVDDSVVSCCSNAPARGLAPTRPTDSTGTYDMLCRPGASAL